MDTSDAGWRVGQTIDRYRIEGVLGAGGFGAVYRARHVVMDRPVALKILRPQSEKAEAELHARFVREAQLLASLGHPNILLVYDSGVTAEGDPFLAMELLEGEDLAERLSRRVQLSVPECVPIIGQVLDALEAAHAAGIVHRDLKPANVFLASKNGGIQVKLLDFGISKLQGVDRRLTKTGVVMGTPHYMAPESFQGIGTVDHRADLYAVGVMLFEMLTGRTPHDADTYEHLIVKVVTEAIPRIETIVSGLDPGFAMAINRSMARDPDARFASAAQMKLALTGHAEGAWSTLGRATAPSSPGKTPLVTPYGATMTPEAAGLAPSPVSPTGGTALAPSGTAPFAPSTQPTPQAPTPQTPMPQTPMPQTPMPQTPMPRTPMPQTPMPQTPMPQAPMPQTPMPQAPMPQTPSTTPTPQARATPDAFRPSTSPSGVSAAQVGRTPPHVPMPARRVPVGVWFALAFLLLASAGTATYFLLGDPSAPVADARPSHDPSRFAAGPLPPAPPHVPISEMKPAPPPEFESTSTAVVRPRGATDPEPAEAPAEESEEEAPVPAPPSSEFRIHEPRAIGSLRTGDVFALAERSTSQLRRCRRAQAHRVLVQLLVGPDGAINIAQPDSENTGDAEVARCVANVLKDNGPLPDGSDGIGWVRVDVPAR